MGQSGGSSRGAPVGPAQAESGRFAVYFADEHLARVKHRLDGIEELVKLAVGQRALAVVRQGETRAQLPRQKSGQARHVCVIVTRITIHRPEDRVTLTFATVPPRMANEVRNANVVDGRLTPPAAAPRVP